MTRSGVATTAQADDRKASVVDDDDTEDNTNGGQTLSASDAQGRSADSESSGKPLVSIETVGVGWDPINPIVDKMIPPNDAIASAVHTSFRGPAAPPLTGDSPVIMDETVQGKPFFKHWPYMRLGSRFAWEKPSSKANTSAMDIAYSTVRVIDDGGLSGAQAPVEGAMVFGGPTGAAVAARAAELENASAILRAEKNASTGVPAWVQEAADTVDDVSDTVATAAADKAADAAGVNMPDGAASKIGGIVGGVVGKVVKDVICDGTVVSADCENAGPTPEPNRVNETLTPPPEAIEAALGVEAAEPASFDPYAAAADAINGAASGVAGDIVKANIPGGWPVGGLKKQKKAQPHRVIEEKEHDKASAKEHSEKATLGMFVPKKGTNDKAVKKQKHHHDKHGVARALAYRAGRA